MISISRIHLFLIVTQAHDKKSGAPPNKVGVLVLSQFFSDGMGPFSRICLIMCVKYA